MGPTILLVENDPHTQRFLAIVLTDQGYTVQTAKDSAQAVQRMADHLPDVILADLTMPMMDGLQLCCLVQDHPIYRTVPIILMSADVQPSAITGCIPTAYLAKPFTLDRLFVVLATSLHPPD